MKKSELRLEFEYSARAYHNGMADVVEYAFKPDGEMKAVMPPDFEMVLTSLADRSLESCFAIAAYNLKEYAAHCAPSGTAFSDKAYFKNDKGEETVVTPSAFIPH